MFPGVERVSVKTDRSHELVNWKCGLSESFTETARKQELFEENSPKTILCMSETKTVIDVFKVLTFNSWDPEVISFDCNGIKVTLEGKSARIAHLIHEDERSKGNKGR